MKPYFERAGITIYHADFRDVVDTLPKVDLIIADPPYGETDLKWDHWIKNFPQVLLNALQPHGSFWCFGSFRMFFEHSAEFAGWRIAQDLIWEKHNGSGMHIDRFRRVHETSVQFYPKGARWSQIYKNPIMVKGGTKKTIRRKLKPAHWHGLQPSVYQSEEGGARLMRSVIYAKSAHGRALNPTEKPEPVISPLIQYSCKPGGTVLDPCMGSGSFLMAALKLGHAAIGIDVRESECETAAMRLSQGVMILE